MLWSRRYRCLFYILALFFLTFVGTGIAAENVNEKAVAQKSSQDIQNQEATIDNGAIKLFMDKIEVLGRLEKPQAVFIVPGSNPEVDDIRIDRSFFSEIFRPVEKGGRRSSRALQKKKERRKDFIPW